MKVITQVHTQKPVKQLSRVSTDCEYCRVVKGQEGKTRDNEHEKRCEVTKRKRHETRKKIREEAEKMAKTKTPGKYLVRENNNETAERTQNLLDTLTFEGEHNTYIVTTKGQKLKAPDFDNLRRMANEMETEARREKGKHMEEWEKHLTGSIRRGELGGEKKLKDKTWKLIMRVLNPDTQILTTAATRTNYVRDYNDREEGGIFGSIDRKGDRTRGEESSGNRQGRETRTSHSGN